MPYMPTRRCTIPASASQAMTSHRSRCSCAGYSSTASPSDEPVPRRSRRGDRIAVLVAQPHVLRPVARGQVVLAVGQRLEDARGGQLVGRRQEQGDREPGAVREGIITRWSVPATCRPSAHPRGPQARCSSSTRTTSANGSPAERVAVAAEHRRRHQQAGDARPPRWPRRPRRSRGRGRGRRPVRPVAARRGRCAGRSPGPGRSRRCAWWPVLPVRARPRPARRASRWQPARVDAARRSPRRRCRSRPARAAAARPSAAARARPAPPRR